MGYVEEKDFALSVFTFLVTGFLSILLSLFLGKVFDTLTLAVIVTAVVLLVFALISMAKNYINSK